MTVKRINFRVEGIDHYRYNLAAQALGVNLRETDAAMMPLFQFKEEAAP